MTTIMPTEPQPDGSLILTLEVSRRDWADLTNTAIETVSRTMSYLADKDLVISLTPRKFRIRDFERLACVAGVEPPPRPSDRRVLPALSDNHAASPAVARGPSAVNASRRSADTFGPIRKRATAHGRGDAGTGLRHIEKEV